jgi:hypothetical protein
METAGTRDQAVEAFGVEPPSGWKRWFRQETAAPKPVARTIGIVTGLALLAAGKHGLLAAAGIVLALGLPGTLVERHYKARRRREREQILPPP